MMGLVFGGLFAVVLTGILAWIFFRLARREEAAKKANPPEPPASAEPR